MASRNSPIVICPAASSRMVFISVCRERPCWRARALSRSMMASSRSRTSTLGILASHVTMPAYC